MSEQPATYDATAWKGGLDREFTVEVNPGRPLVYKKLSLVDELVRGTVPNELLKHIVFDSLPDDDDDAKAAERQAETWQNHLRICARALVRPRLKLKGTPNYAQGEIAPSDLTWAEVYEISYRAIREVVPPLADAPFRSDGSDDGEPEPVASPGADVSHDAEPVVAPA